MRKYRRVAYEDRCHISALLQAEYTIVEVSTVLGFHKSTIYREVSRNGFRGVYKPAKALIKAAKRYRRCRKKKLISAELKEIIMVYFSFGWSPEQIAGRMKDEKRYSISYQTIYRKFNKETLGYKLLRKGNRRRSGGRSSQRRALRRSRVHISKRPTIVEQRKRIGDWERDGMYGANRQQLLIFTERKSRFIKIKKMGTGISKEVTKITQRTMDSLGKKVFTMTNDNGTEFNDSASLPFKTYHCEPNRPQQRGTVENTIGLLRQYIKRNTDLDSLTENDLQQVENRVNFRPRKCLNYKTPFEVFFKQKVALVL